MSKLQAIEQDAEKLKEDAGRIVGDMQRLSEAFKSLASDSWKGARREVSQLYSQGKSRYHEAESRFGDRIKAKPVQAVLLTAGIGFVLGRFKKYKNHNS